MDKLFWQVEKLFWQVEKLSIMECEKFILSDWSLPNIPIKSEQTTDHSLYSYSRVFALTLRIDFKHIVLGISQPSQVKHWFVHKKILPFLYLWKEFTGLNVDKKKRWELLPWTPAEFYHEQLHHSISGLKWYFFGSKGKGHGIRPWRGLPPNGRRRFPPKQHSVQAYL